MRNDRRGGFKTRPFHLGSVRKGDFRVDRFRVEDFGVRGLPAVGAEFPEKAGLVTQFAGAARGIFTPTLTLPSRGRKLKTFRMKTNYCFPLALRALTRLR